MNQKAKPSLWLLTIPVLVLLVAFVFAVPMMTSSFTEISDLETQVMGTEFEVEAQAEDQFNVYLEIDFDEFVDSITVEGEIVRVIVEDNDGNRDVYFFELFYYGTNEASYEVNEPFGSSTIGNLTLVFVYEFETSGTYGVLAESEDAFQTEFSVNQINAIGMIAGIFGGIMVIFLGGIIAIIITAVIFILRYKNKQKLIQSASQRPFPENPFE